MNFKILGAMLTLSFSLMTGKAFAQDNYSVLAYHSVVDESAPKSQQLFVSQTIPVQKLISHFNWLKDNGYNVISWQQVIDAEKGKGTLPPKAVVLSFDDGYETMYSVVYPLLKAYQYPAVFAPVTKWINTPAGGKIDYGNQMLDRATFFSTWAQISEMRRSGLVEIASHSYDSHHGVVANPTGSQQPAMLAPIYQNGKYESEAQYKARVNQDLRRSANDIAKQAGKAPSIIVWPYGAFNNIAIEQAKSAGMPYYFTLKEKINRVGDAHVGRFLVDAETELGVLKNYLERTENPTDTAVERVLQIRLDEIDDPNPAQFEKNYNALINRVYKAGVTTVYLSGFSDPNQDGVIDAVYFPNTVLPVKADRFSQVAWQLRKRAGVNVYAWMPSSLNNLPPEARTESAMVNLFKSLALYTKFDGVFFDDHLNPNDWASHDASTIRLTENAKNAMAPYFYWGNENIKTARNLNPQAVDFTQTFANYRQAYNMVVVNVEDNPKAIIESVQQHQLPANKIIFNFNNEENGQLISSSQLIEKTKQLEKAGLMNLSYTFNHFLTEEKTLNELKPYISTNRDVTRN